MPIPKIYRSGANQIVNSFSFSDVISGSAIQQFYLAETKQDTTITQVLTSTPFYSTKVETDSAVPGGTAVFTKLSDLDFDITCNIPRTMQGTGILNIPIFVRTGSGGTTISGYIVARVRRYSGTTETEIASSQTETITGTTTPTYKMLSTQIVIPRTSFGIGDIIRLTIEVWGKTDTASAGNVIIATDPQNRAGEVYMTSGRVTTAIFLCPFNLSS